MTLTALYFGSFNPLHKGHLQIANYVLSNLPVNEFTFVLSPLSPLKDAATEANKYERLANLESIVKRFTAKYQKEHKCNKLIDVSDIEFSLPSPLYTYNTLKAFSANFPDKKFILIMGADNIAIIEKWYKWQDILNEYDVYVYPRSGFDGKTLCKKYGVNYLDGEIVNISSTQIRNKVVKNDLGL